MPIFKMTLVSISVIMFMACAKVDNSAGPPPTTEQARIALDKYLVEFYPNGDETKDITFGQMRSTSDLMSPTQRVYFVCARYQVKNPGGYYASYSKTLVAFKNLDEGPEEVLFTHKPGSNAYDQHCRDHPHKR